MALPAQNFQSYPIMHCDFRPKRKDLGFLTCMEETVFQAFFAMRNKHAVSGSVIVYLGCDFARTMWPARKFSSDRKTTEMSQ